MITDSFTDNKSGDGPLFRIVREKKGGGMMAKKESYESRVEAFLLPLMEENHFELVDVEYVKEAGTWYLRAYIDKEGGIAVDDCESSADSWGTGWTKRILFPKATFWK